MFTHSMTGAAAAMLLGLAGCISDAEKAPDAGPGGPGGRHDAHTDAGPGGQSGGGPGGQNAIDAAFGGGGQGGQVSIDAGFGGHDIGVTSPFPCDTLRAEWHTFTAAHAGCAQGSDCIILGAPESCDCVPVFGTAALNRDAQDAAQAYIDRFDAPECAPLRED